MGHIRPEWIHGYGDADAREQTRVTKMTNNQIPITNENDNDQFTNNQLNEAKGGLPVSFLSWLLVIVCFSGHWDLVIGHYPLRKTHPSPITCLFFLLSYHRVERRVLALDQRSEQLRGGELAGFLQPLTRK